MTLAEPTPDDAALTALTAFADAALGGSLPARAADLIARAGALRAQPHAALPLLERARSLAPAHPAPVIALYRFHFYGHALPQARAVGEDALVMARAALGASFGAAPLADEASAAGLLAAEPFTDAAVRHDAAVRFYLFTLKGLAYLDLRLGDLVAAQRRLTELRHLDPQDHIGGALLQHVLDRHLARPVDEADNEADGDADGALRAHPARGWTADEA